MIPKIIHYCWFGEKEKPYLLQECIDTWYKLLPDYQIIEWNNSNYIPHSFYTQKAFEEKKWAFLSDYVRLEKLYEMGGIYLDTDMYLINNFSSLDLSKEIIICAEDNERLNAAFMASVMNHEFLKYCINYYNELSINKDFDYLPIPIIMTHLFKKFYNKEINFTENIDTNEFLLLVKDYFYPFPYAHKHNKSNFLKYAKENTIAIHLWDHSWKEKDEFDYLKNQQYIQAFKIIFNKLFSFQKKHYIGYYHSIKDFAVNRYNFFSRNDN